MLIFDMTVTALNNYADHKRAVKKHGYNYEVHNSIVQYNLKQTTVLAVIIVMSILSAALGILLVCRTSWITLVLGGLCFMIGFAYSFGPLPISRTPFGEVFSGVTMGAGIPFITYYANVFDQNVLDVSVGHPMVTLAFDAYQIAGNPTGLLARRIWDSKHHARQQHLRYRGRYAKQALYAADRHRQG